MSLCSLPSHLLKRVKQRIDALDLQDTPFLVAVSGGADSMACAALLAEARHPLLGLAFCDHGLRPVEPEEEAARSLAHRLSLPFHTLRLNLNPGPNLQARARDARYQALRELLPQGALLATGHTLSDQAETVLQRLIRGSGIAGLSGLYPRLEQVVRPILDLSRDETRALNTGYVDDPSNATDAYQRNRVRHHLIPLLKEENPRIEHQLALLADTARGESALLDTLVAHLPDLSHEGLSLEASRAYLHHLSRIAGLNPSRESLIRWAEAVIGDLRGQQTLGDDYVGLSESHRARFSREEDPRRRLLLKELGHWQFRGLDICLSEHLGTSPKLMSSAHLLTIPRSACVFPLTLRVKPHRQRPSKHTPLHVLCTLEDASGRDLFRYSKLLGNEANPQDRWLQVQVRTSA